MGEIFITNEGIRPYPHQQLFGDVVQQLIIEQRARELFHASKLDQLRLRTLRSLFLGSERKLPSASDTQEFEFSVNTLVVLGSGGHTTEMLQLIDATKASLFSPLHFVIASTDNHSAEKAKELVKRHNQQSDKQNQQMKYEHQHASIHYVSRSREVGQTYLSSTVTTLLALVESFPLILRLRPELILVNGPGSCVPVCIAAFVLKVFAISCTSVVYVESICRTETLSLSARILQWIADLCIVRWPELESQSCLFVSGHQEKSSSR
eukprot:gene10986-3058_t